MTFRLLAFNGHYYTFVSAHATYAAAHAERSRLMGFGGGLYVIEGK